jgi:hypothetical protein
MRIVRSFSVDPSPTEIIDGRDNDGTDNHIGWRADVEAVHENWELASRDVVKKVKHTNRCQIFNKIGRHLFKSEVREL